MNDKVEYYVMRAMVSEMSAGNQAKVSEAEAAALTKQSDAVNIGPLMAMLCLATEA